MDADLDKAKRGDREAMARLVDEYYDIVFRFLARQVGSDTAQDLAQETFITAQKSLRRFEGRSTFRSWLLGIAMNHVRNARRSMRTEAVDWLEDLSGENPESSIVNRHALRSALRSLSEEHREVVLLHEVDGLTYEEAAAVLGVPSGTVKSRLHHAFLALRKSMLGPEVSA